MKKYYLAYGSNLNVQQMKHRCPLAKPIGTAWIQGYQLLFKGSKTGSYLTIEKAENSAVPVAVWEVSEIDEQHLDAYEGFPNFYYKREISLPVEILGTDKIETLNTFVYIMHEERELGTPTRAYMDCCLEGYCDFGFDTQFLKDALKKSVR